MGVTRDIEVNRLLISDPSLYLDIELRLGWYAGNKYQPNLQDDISRVIKHLTNGQRVVLFGASGGGFAALEQSLRLQGGVTAVVSNPQTNIFNYYKTVSDNYLSVAWGIKDSDLIPFTSSVVTGYREKVDAKVLYLQNSGDTYHVSRHMIPFMDSLHPENQVEVMTPYIGKGHIGPGKDSFIDLLSKVCLPDSFNALSTLGRLVNYTK